MGGLAMLPVVVALALEGPASNAVDGLAWDEAQAVPLQVSDDDGELLRRTPMLHGLPVRGAYEVVRRGPDGSERTLASRGVTKAARTRPDEARLTADDVVAELAARGEPAPRRPPQLVYWMMLDTPVLAWEVELPFEPGPPPSLRTVWLGARSGRLLDEYDAAFSSRAHVFAEDPSTTPEPIEVELFTLDVQTEGQPLRSETYEVFGCGDTPRDDLPAWAESFQCIPQQLALSDAMGDFFVPLPDIGRIEENNAVDDPYAEVAAYYYSEHFFDVMMQRGLTETRCESFTTLVNIHQRDEYGGLVGMEGATYIDQCDPDVAPQMTIGQGNDADYAYDAGVMYHELGHSVIQDLVPGGLSQRSYSPIGIISEAGAINEGLADYFSMTVSDDPLMAEYVGRFSVASGAPYLRDGRNQKVCPRDMVSSWHHDSQPVSAALWAIRERLGAEATDRLVLETMPRLPSDAVLDVFGSTLWEVAQEQHQVGVLDDFGLEFVWRSLDSRGLIECLHVLDEEALVTGGKRIAVVEAGDRVQPFGPGPLQLRYEVPDDASEVTIWFSMSGGVPEERAASLFISRDGEPVLFEYETRPPMGDEEADEVIMVSVVGDALELVPESLNGQDFIARLAVEPGEVLHVAFGNRTPDTVAANNFFVVASEPTMVPEEDDDGGDADGCGCRGGGRAPSPWWLLGMMGVALVRRRRG